MWALFRRRRAPGMWGQHPGEMVPCSGPGKANPRSIRGVSAALHVGTLGSSQAWPEDPHVPPRASETPFGAVGSRGQSRRPARALSATAGATGITAAERRLWGRRCRPPDYGAKEYKEVQRQARRGPRQGGLHQGCSRACPGGGTSRTHAARLDIGHLDMYLDTSGHFSQTAVSHAHRG